MKIIETAQNLGFLNDKADFDFDDLMIEHPDCIRIIDRYPFVIQDNDKYLELEKMMDDQDSKLQSVKERLMTIMALLWGRDRSVYRYTGENPEIEMIRIDSLSAFTKIADSAIDEESNELFIFDDQQIIIHLHGLVPTLFIGKSENMQSLDRICAVERLYLRAISN